MLRRRFNRDLTQPKPKADLAAQLASCPILAVAIDTAEGSEPLNEALRVTAGGILATLPSARLACLNVLKLGRVTIDKTLDEQGNNKHIDRMVALKHWASPLKLDEGRLTVHVLEAMDPAAAILEFCAVNHVDHIVIGARRSSLVRKLLGSVSARVAAEATCTVTVVGRRGWQRCRSWREPARSPTRAATSCAERRKVRRGGWLFVPPVPVAGDACSRRPRSRTTLP